jgi:hypothetical protein
MAVGGLVAGIVAFGLGEGVRAFLPSSRLSWVVSSLLLVHGGMYVLGYPERVISRRWMIPRSLVDGTVWKTSIAFGFNLGLGFRTRLSSNLWWIMVAAAVLETRLWLAVAPFLLFSIWRGVPAILLLVTRSRAAAAEAYRVPIAAAPLRLSRRLAESPVTNVCSGLLAFAAVSGILRRYGS